MAYETKTNTGSLFKNIRKTEDTHADRTGNIVVECPACGQKTDYWLNGWLKQSDKVGQWLSLSLRTRQMQKPPEPRRPIEEDLSDEIPY